MIRYGHQIDGLDVRERETVRMGSRFSHMFLAE